MALHYDPAIMLLFYSRVNPGANAVTAEDLAQLDQDWFIHRDATLTRIMTEREVKSIDAHSKAMVIVLQLDMDGNIFETRAPRACDLLKSATNAM